jgi:hypothetical protein
LKSQVILKKNFWSEKPVNSITNIGLGYLCLSEENLRFNNNLGIVNFNDKYVLLTILVSKH